MARSSIMAALPEQAARDLALERLRIKAVAGRKLNKSYIPYGAAAKLMTLEVPEVVLSGAAGTGKSRACLERIVEIATENKGARILLVRQTRASMTESVLVTLERHVLGEHHPAVASGTSRNYRQTYNFPNGSVLVPVGMDHPEKILSSEWDIAYVNQAEELPENAWETISTRLRNNAVRFQGIIADCNPDAANHWLKRRCDEGRCLMLQSKHEENPLLYDRNGEMTPFGRQYLSKLDNLSGVRYQRLRLGLWVSAEGVVYENFSKAQNVIKPFVIPGDWRRFASVDFGYTNPFCCQWWAMDPTNGNMYMYREIYKTKRTVSRHVQMIRDVQGIEPVECFVADHDAEDRATMVELGLSVIPATKDITVGVQRVDERFKGNNGSASIFFFDNALLEVDPDLIEAKLPFCTVDEIEGYVWPKSSATGKPIKEVPVGINNHGCDAMRYAVMYANTAASFANFEAPPVMVNKWVVT